jgi:C-terminal processing protease CtpA/Prc
MFRMLRLSALLLCALPLAAQLTTAQREADFIQLGNLFWKQYGPYEWKKQLFNHDLADLRPWLQQVRATRNDVEYLEICSRYVTALRDSHTFFGIPSSYQAVIDIDTDIYDGRILIEGFSRTTLPADRFPIRLGDEIVSVDGKPAMDVVRNEIAPFIGFPSFERHLMRFAADYLFFRPGSRLPRAHEVSENAMIVARHADGEEYTMSIPWRKRGTPVTSLGTLPGLITASSFVRQSSNVDGTQDIALPVDTPDYLRGLLQLGHTAAPAFPRRDVEEGEAAMGLIGFGSNAPYYSLPAGFELRQTNNFVCGRFTSGGRRIGFMRFGSMSPPLGLANAYAELDREVRWLQENTDGLIVDVSRNSGGFVIYVNELCRRLTREPFDVISFEMRATAGRIQSLSNELENLRLSNSPSWVIQLYEKILEDVRTAYNENRGRTGGIPLNQASIRTLPATDAQNLPYGYSKPMIILIDEFSVSGGDAFPATMQDAGRAKLVGFRTGGLGATNGSYSASPLSETTAGVSFGLMVRPRPISVEGYPATNYVENVGVHPDIAVDYMTAENLLQNGRPFFTRVTEIMLQEINR